MSKYLLPMNLQLFAEEVAVDPGVESVPAAEGQATPGVEASEPGAEKEVAAEPEKQNNFEKAFAKRLADAQAKWEAEAQERYKGHEDFKLVADYLQEANGMDLLTLKEQIELERLQARAEKEQVSPEVLRRIDQLEAKAAKVDEYEQKQQQEQWEKSYWSGINEFAKDKGVESEKLNQFMIDNGLYVNPNDMNKSFEIALKAMKHDELAAQVESAEKEGVKKFLAAKGSIPTVPGSAAQGQVTSPQPKTFAEARQRAMQRMTGEG